MRGGVCVAIRRVLRDVACRCRGGRVATLQQSRKQLATDDARLAIAHHSSGPRVLGVDDGESVSGEKLKEPGFGRGVSVHGFVVIKMVAGEIGKDADGES